MPRVGRNKDGLPDHSAPKDTIEIHAHFTEDVGFFGLTSFLQYVRTELRQCAEWNEKCRRAHSPHHRFVWTDVSEDEVEAEGFLRKTFNFDIDTKKILDLLIGHTLYNDTSVVLRELVQNSLDAVRLQSIIDGHSFEGLIKIEWSSKDRTLSVTDNGTGMTQDIIERHLLKAGSSRYQSLDFKENFPEFSPISRFGIGVLSAFMVSDNVEITTCAIDDEHARRIALRSVHGRYLIRLIDKGNRSELAELAPHGTRFRLKVRASAEIGNFAALARRWIIIPGCKILLSIDGSDPEVVGYDSPKSALTKFFQKRGLDVDGQEREGCIRIVQKEKNGITLAFGVRWSEYFKDWTLVSAADGLDNEIGIPSTCIEGIAVEFTTPGLRGRGVPAIANATGKNAPKTNVARSNLEATQEREDLLRTLYDLYVDHVSNELVRMQSHYSKTWAISNAPMLIYAVLSGDERGGAIRPDCLKESIRKLPLFITERSGRRSSISFQELRMVGKFYTVDSALIRSGEQMIKETAGNATISAIIESLGDRSLAMPEGTLLCNFGTSIVSRNVEEECEPVLIRVIENQRRVDIEWQSATGRWMRVQKILEECKQFRNPLVTHSMRVLSNLMPDRTNRANQLNGLWIPKCDVTFECSNDVSAVRAYGRTYIRNDLAVAKFLREILSSSSLEDNVVRFLIYSHIAVQFIERGGARGDLSGYLHNFMKRVSLEIGDGIMTRNDEFIDSITSEPLKIFDVSTWDRRSHTSLDN
nr:ATP-binding protein [Azospirillum oleiclasticum]